MDSNRASLPSSFTTRYYLHSQLLFLLIGLTYPGLYLALPAKQSIPLLCKGRKDEVSEIAHLIPPCLSNLALETQSHIVFRKFR